MSTLPSESSLDPRSTLRTFILDNFLFSDDPEELNDQQSFLETGVVDSTGILEIVMFLEESFNIKVEDEEMVPDNLDSVDAAIKFIARKQAQSADGS